MTAHGPGRTLPPSSPTQDKYLKEDPAADSGVAWAEAAGGGLSPATPITTTTLPNPITGSGTMTVAVVPADNPILAVMLEGDDFPRLLINADPGDFAAIQLGNGTVDPTTQGVSLGLANDSGDPAVDMDLVLSVQSGNRIVLAGEVHLPANDLVFLGGAGVVLSAPNGAQHRLVVANDGTLSTEAI